MILAVVGPTGTGKSDLSLRIAHELSSRGRAAEIVNADAMQLYRGMDIGTAKLPVDERQGVPHHLLDVLDVTEESTVARYQPAARAAIDGILARGSVPILVGGSGLYVSSVLFDFAFPARDPAVRAEIEAELAEVGGSALHARLRSVDPEAAERIDPANSRRVVRALEVAQVTGLPVSASLPEEPRPWHPHRLIALRVPRERLVPRLDERVERMWTAGLPEEAAALIPAGIERGVTASRAIGYAQALAQLRGDSTRDEAIAETQRLTRRYARRQVSWFGRYPGLVWQEPDDVDVAAVGAQLAPVG